MNLIKGRHVVLPGFTTGGKDIYGQVPILSLHIRSDAFHEKKSPHLGVVPTTPKWGDFFVATDPYIIITSMHILRNLVEG